MHIEVSTDNNIDGSAVLKNHIAGLVRHELANMDRHITWIEDHLSDHDADRKGHDGMQCMLEVRLEGLQSTVVKDGAETIDQATGGAALKMKRALQSMLGRIADRR